MSHAALPTVNRLMTLSSYSLENISYGRRKLGETMSGDADGFGPTAGDMGGVGEIGNR